MTPQTDNRVEFSTPLRAGCHSSDNSLSTIACTSLDTFDIVHALLDRVDRCAWTYFVTSFTVCPARRSAETFARLFLCGTILKYTTITSLFSSMSQSQSIGWVKQKPDNNYQITRIVSKGFVQFFSTHPVT